MPTRTPTPTPTPSPTPETETKYFSLGEPEYFDDDTWIAIIAGDSLRNKGEYWAAIFSYRDAAIKHGKMSATIENQLGLAYDGLGMYEEAIEHFTNAINIGDDSVRRINRGQTYVENEQYGLAIIDAEKVLSMEPLFDVGIHTYAEAHMILMDGYFFTGEYRLALKHTKEAIAFAKLHQYPVGHIEILEENEVAIQSYIE